METKTFGKWVFEKRESLGISRKALSEKIGVSSEYIRTIELGKRTPSNPVRVALEMALTTEADLDLAILKSPRPPSHVRGRGGKDVSRPVSASKIAENALDIAYNAGVRDALSVILRKIKDQKEPDLEFVIFEINEALAKARVTASILQSQVSHAL